VLSNGIYGWYLHLKWNEHIWEQTSLNPNDKNKFGFAATHMLFQEQYAVLNLLRAYMYGKILVVELARPQPQDYNKRSTEL
jgi:predicted DCC family thiol-disulfide oxidoreductase YuxK